MKTRKPKLKHRAAFVLAYWWLTLLLALGLALMMFGEKGARQSSLENRMLQEFPRITLERVLSGEFMAEFEAYLSDAFFARDQVVLLSTDLMDTLSTVTAREVLLTDLGDALEDEFTSAQPEEDMPEDIPEEPEELEDAPEEGQPPREKYEPLDHYELRLIRADGGTDVVESYSPESVKRFMVGLRYVLDALPEDGTLNVVLAQNAQAANMWLFDTDTYVGWESDVEEYLAAMAPDRMHIINAASVLNGPMSEGAYVYFRTDNHWTPLGAGLVCSAVLENQGYPAAGYDDFAYKTVPGYLGAVYGQNPSAALRAMADNLDLVYPNQPVRSYVLRAGGRTEIDFMDYSGSGYGNILLGSQPPWRVLITGNCTGRKALVISDSFGTAFATYLVAHYDEVHMVDLRPGRFDAAEAGGSPLELTRKYGIDDAFVILARSSGPNHEYANSLIAKYFRP